METLKEVRDLNPERIDWSNLPDYMTIENFFSMAKLCSTSKTEHTFHLLSWTSKVFGASLFDYFLPYPDQRYFIDENGRTCKMYMKLERDFIALVDRDVGNMSFIKIDPKLLDIINTSERALSHQYFHFFVDFMFKNKHLSSLNWDMDPYSPFARANTQANVRFKFEAGTNSLP